MLSCEQVQIFGALFTAYTVAYSCFLSLLPSLSHWKLVSPCWLSMASSSRPSSSSPHGCSKYDGASLPSSSLAHRWKYDVFLSFRGADTRKGITSDLYRRLQRRGIRAFMDSPDLEVGDAISSTLVTAIEESRFAVVVLSRDYASSPWCLDELTKICECMKDNNRILPLFFDVEPSHVRHQKRSFREAFCNHESSGRYGSGKMQRWRDALKKVADFSGWNTQDYKTHKELVDEIVEFLGTKILPDAIESAGDFGEYKATRQAMDEVMKGLTEDGITAFGVYGMGGVGKTSMVKHVAAQACGKGTFNHRIMVAITQNPDLKNVQGTLAELLGFQLAEKTVPGRAATLHREIMKREKILIILDDVWKRIELSEIGIPSYKDLQKCKSKVLLTTRIRKVCLDMECHKHITLNILSEDDSWALFVRNAGMTFESTKFEGVAKRVAGECKGLPIALIAVARALRDEDLQEWEKAAQRLEKSQIASPNHEEDAFKCIRLSYNYLKKEDHKSCFLLCCLFPEDHNIRIEDLFRYAIGKGLFQDTETIDEARGAVDSVVKFLKDSSLLMDSKYIGFVKMHDVIRDTALNIGESEDGPRFLVKAGCGLKEWQPRSLHKGCTSISLMWNEIRRLPEEDLVCPNLQILLLNRNFDLNEIPEKFIRSLNELRVLDLSRTNISLLPHQSFSLPTNLQALNLDYCKRMSDISVIGKLKKLEILSMRNYPLKELSREIGHLTSLRMLDVNDSCIVTIPSGVISKLHRLEELYMMDCGFVNWGRQIEGEGEETNMGFGEIAGLPKLKILQVWLSGVECIPENVEVEPGWVYFDIRINVDTANARYWFDRNSTYSRSLSLSETMSTLPDWFVNAVTSKTEKLRYHYCKGLSDIVKEFDHGRLHELKHLIVAGDRFDESYVYMEGLMNTTGRVQKGPVFEKLEELHLSQLFHLKELCVGELPPRSLSNLKLLRIEYCDKLKNVSEFVQRLPNLETLYLKEMMRLEHVFGWEGFEPKQSKLREMHLDGLDSVKSICSGPAPRVIFRCLKTLTIYKCKVLQSLFASDVAECLVQLEELVVNDCPLLERVIEAVKNEKTVLPKLNKLILKDLPKLYAASATADIECPSLEILIVVRCSQIPFSTTSEALEKSWNQFSFSSSASDYFGSTNPVKLIDPQHSSSPDFPLLY